MGHFNFLYPFKRLLTRWRYPVCCPEDIAQALGMRLSNQLTFEELVCKLTSPHCYAKNLYKYMSRISAEAAFKNALRIERFSHTTIVSYYFSEGWMEFTLHFDAEEHLRRVYIQHQCIPDNKGIEIPLKTISEVNPSYSNSQKMFTFSPF